MMPSPSPGDAARHILRLFVGKFNRRAGDGLRLNNLLMEFAKHPWQVSDLEPGLRFAREAGWLDSDDSLRSIKLTEKGYALFADDEMNLTMRCKELVTLEKPDGSRHEGVRALVTGEMILIPNATLPVEQGDAVLRKLPSDIVERFIVREPGFYAASQGFPAHYQIKYGRDGQMPDGSPGHHFHVTGENARINVNSLDNSTNTVKHGTEDLSALVDQFATLRAALLTKASAAEHYAAIGAVANAELAAKSGDRSKMKTALAALGGAGRWVFDVARDVSADIAAKVISESMKG